MHIFRSVANAAVDSGYLSWRSTPEQLETIFLFEKKGFCGSEKELNMNPEPRIQFYKDWKTLGGAFPRSSPKLTSYLPAASASLP